MKNLLFCLIAIIFSACASTNQTAKLVGNLRTELKIKYTIKDGELMAKFDLGNLSKKENKLFIPYYGGVVNDKNQNNKFLSDFAKKYHGKESLQVNAYSKLNILNNALLKLDEQYNLLSSSLKKTIQTIKRRFARVPERPQDDHEDYISILARLHNSTKNIPLFVPIENPILTSKFGMRKRAEKNKAIHHTGVDLVGKKNCKIYAAADGVVEAIAKAKGYGNMVVIRHNNDLKTRYAHLSLIKVFEGDKVLLGQNIGSQGSSGTATGQHLHLEILFKNKAVDPLPFIAHSL